MPIGNHGKIIYRANCDFSISEEKESQARKTYYTTDNTKKIFPFFSGWGGWGGLLSFFTISESELVVVARKVVLSEHPPPPNPPERAQ